MRRPLPAGLTDRQRTVLSEFFAGRITAGELSQRLLHRPATSKEPPPPHGGVPVAVGAGSAEAATEAFPSQPGAVTRGSRERTRRVAWLIPLVAAALAGSAIGASLGSTRHLAAAPRGGHQRLRHRSHVARRTHIAHARVGLPPPTAAPSTTAGAPAASVGAGSSTPTTSTTATTTPATTSSRTTPGAHAISTPSTASTTTPTTSTRSATTAPPTAPATQQSNPATSTTPTTSTTG